MVQARGKVRAQEELSTVRLRPLKARDTRLERQVKPVREIGHGTVESTEHDDLKHLRFVVPRAQGRKLRLREPCSRVKGVGGSKRVA